MSKVKHYLDLMSQAEQADMVGNHSLAGEIMDDMDEVWLTMNKSEKEEAERKISLMNDIET